MINLTAVKQFCKDYTKIENYEDAVNDQSQVWICHHILGEILSREQLLDHDFYYDVPPCMLKFVTRAEHNILHFKGKHISLEARIKISEANKGLNSSWYGKHHSEETRRKISESLKGEHFSEERRRKISEAAKRRTGENNGFYGKCHSNDTKKKISEANKGKLKGVSKTAETRRKMSEAAKIRWARKRELLSHRELA